VRVHVLGQVSVGFRGGFVHETGQHLYTTSGGRDPTSESNAESRREVSNGPSALV
jgi:hypothetical protein